MAREMFADDIQLTVALDACRKQASDLLTTHWSAVKTLAGALLALQWVTGAEAHTIIGEALREEQDDWRWDVLQAVMTEQELDDGMARIQEERLKLLQSTPAWHFFGSLF